MAKLRHYILGPMFSNTDNEDTVFKEELIDIQFVYQLTRETIRSEYEGATRGFRKHSERVPGDSATSAFPTPGRQTCENRQSSVEATTPPLQSPVELCRPYQKHPHDTDKHSPSSRHSNWLTLRSFTSIVAIAQQVLQPLPASG